jgi:mono/diheme cytochrome c family protein
MRILLSLLLGSFLAAPIALCAGEKVEVEMWIRKPGATSNADAKDNLKKINLKGMTFDELKTVDIQYGAENRYRGMHLRDLIAAYKPLPLSATMILLHSANGMVIPLSIPRLRADRQVFIALEIFKDNAWTSNFPASIRPDPNVKDEHPLKFTGAKLVVGSDWRATESTFTPWRHFDTLAGIEFAEETPYNEQFASKEKMADQSGRGIFLARCQFCHALKGLAGSRAADLSTLLTTDDKAAVTKLFNLVSVVKPKYEQLTHAMPQQTNFTKRHAKQLLTWLKNIQSKELKGYFPSYPTVDATATPRP